MDDTNRQTRSQAQHHVSGNSAAVSSSVVAAAAAAGSRKGSRRLSLVSPGGSNTSLMADDKGGNQKKEEGFNKGSMEAKGGVAPVVQTRSSRLPLPWYEKGMESYLFDGRQPMFPPAGTPGKKMNTAKQQQQQQQQQQQSAGVEVEGGGKEEKKEEAAFPSSSASSGIRTRSRSAALGGDTNGSKAKRQRPAKGVMPLTSAPLARMRTRQYDRMLCFAPWDDEDEEEDNEEDEEEEDEEEDGRPVGLCLGMIRMKDTFMDGYKGCADPMVDVAAARDTYRMRILEEETGMDIIALADAREIEEVDHVRGRRKGKHVSCLFENAPLCVVQRALRKRKISFIFGDYIRFPTAYFRPVYSAVAKKLLVDLRASGLLAPECQVYLPFLNLYDGIDNVFEGIMADKTLAPTLVREGENPLYRATKTMFEEDHVHKCEGLMRESPFLRLTIKSTKK